MEKIARLYRQGVPAPALAERFGVVTSTRAKIAQLTGQGRNERCRVERYSFGWCKRKPGPQPA